MLICCRAFVPQRDLPERLHRADPKARLPVTAQPGSDVSDARTSSTRHVSTAQQKQLFIRAAGVRFAFLGIKLSATELRL